MVAMFVSRRLVNSVGTTPTGGSLQILHFNKSVVMDFSLLLSNIRRPDFKDDLIDLTNEFNEEGTIKSSRRKQNFVRAVIFMTVLDALLDTKYTLSSFLNPFYAVCTQVNRSGFYINGDIEGGFFIWQVVGDKFETCDTVKVFDFITDNIEVLNAHADLRMTEFGDDLKKYGRFLQLMAQSSVYEMGTFV